MTLKELCGQKVQVFIQASDITGSVWGDLSQDGVGGDYIVKGASGFIIFNEQALDHINDSDQQAVLVFIKD